MGIFNFLFGNRKNQVQDYTNKGAIILDVRTPKEYNTEHIEGALHIPITELKDRLEEVKSHNKPIIAYCRSGVRSAQAKQILNSNGCDAINGGGIAKLKADLKH